MVSGQSVLKNLPPLLKNIAFAIGVSILLLVPIVASRSLQPAPSQATPNAVLPEPTEDINTSPNLPEPTARHTAAPASTPMPSSTIAVAPADLQGLEIRVWHPWGGEGGKTLQALIGEFNATNEWGLSIEVEQFGDHDAQFEAMETALQAGEPPDLVLAYPYQSLAWEAGKKGSVIDLTPYINDPVWGFQPGEIEDYFPLFFEQDLVAGKRIGFPVTRSAQLLYYNTTWASELGFAQAPETPAQFTTQACAAAHANSQDDARDNDSTGGWIISTDYLTVLGWLYAFDSQVVDPGGKAYHLGADEAGEALKFLRDLYEQGCAWLNEDEAGETDFANRLGLFAAGSMTGIARQEDAFADAHSKDNWTVIPFPGPVQPAIVSYGPSFTLLESTPERQLAGWLFLRWLSQPDKQARLAQASGTYPARASALEHLEREPLPQWTAAIDLLPYFHPEPNLRSWRVVRWAVSDAATQLFRWYFSSEQLPATLQLLGETADELQRREP
jgi:multiple sugar transport system substrate-binding protein/sn-glycerol 3-phosphate transport system substrate-binding protein